MTIKKYGAAAARRRNRTCGGYRLLADTDATNAAFLEYVPRRQSTTGALTASDS